MNYDQYHISKILVVTCLTIEAVLTNRDPSSYSLVDHGFQEVDIT